MNDLISVIIPIYKVEDYLPKCIESLICQSYQNLEIILVDDGSPDDCGKICDEFATKDSRIRVIHKENGGLSDARNAGLKIMTGMYVTFIDSDDWVSDDYVEFMYNKICQYDADIVVTPLCSVNEESKNISREFTSKTMVMDAAQAMVNMFSSNGISWCAQAKLYRKELFSDVEYPVGMVMEDKATTYKIYDKCNKIVFIDTPKYMYLVRKGSIMRSGISEKRVKSFDVQIQLNSFIENNYPNAVATAHAYTVKVALSFICYLHNQSDKYFDMEEQLFRYLIQYKIEFKACDSIDYRFKILYFAMITLRKFKGKNIYRSVIFKIICNKVSNILLEK